MAIDDNTIYGLYGSQIKDLPEKINAVKGKAKVLTSADYNWPVANPDGVAMWLLTTGIYSVATGTKIYVTASSSDTSRYKGLFLLHSNGYQCSYLMIKGADAVMQYWDMNIANSVVREQFAISQPVDNLTSSSEYAPLSANQGKVLKDFIGDLTNLTTTDKTNLVAAINEAAGGGGGITELTSADYNYPTANPDGIALWLLEPGFYNHASGVKVYWDNSFGAGTLPALSVIASDSDNTYVTIIEVGTTVAGYLHKYVTRVYDGASQKSASIMTNDFIVNTTGTSTGAVMSQNATTSMVFADPSTKRKVTIGDNANNNGNYGVVIGANATKNASNGIAIGNDAAVNAYNAVAIGAYSRATMVGEMNIGTPDYDYGYNNSRYRLLTGLYDGQSAHDAATYGQVISYSAINGAGAPTTATEGKYVGQLYYDTTNEAMYFLKTIDTTTTPATYTWEALGGGATYTAGDGIDITNAVISATNTGKAKILTTADYNANSANWADTDPANFNCIALWKLDSGIYHGDTTADIPMYIARNNSVTGSRQQTFIIGKGSSQTMIMSIYDAGVDSSSLINVTGSDGVPNTYQSNRRILFDTAISQSYGTSTTNVMSQNAVTSMIFTDPSTRYKVRIGSGASVAAGITGDSSIAIGKNATASYSGALALGAEATITSNAAGGVAIGYNASADGQTSVALGSYSSATSKGQFDIGASRGGGTYGYNNSAYRLLTGLYDPQSDHDAATKGYVDTAVGAKQDVLTAGDNITIAEESGALVISATGGSSIDTFTTNEWNALWA